MSDIPGLDIQGPEKCFPGFLMTISWDFHNIADEPIWKHTWFCVAVVVVPVALVKIVVAVLRLLKWNKRRKQLNNQNDNNVAKQSFPLKPRK